MNSYKLDAEFLGGIQNLSGSLTSKLKFELEIGILILELKFEAKVEDLGLMYCPMDDNLWNKIRFAAYAGSCLFFNLIGKNSTLFMGKKYL